MIKNGIYLIWGQNKMEGLLGFITTNKYGLIVILLILALFGYSWYKDKRKKEQPNHPPQEKKMNSTSFDSLYLDPDLGGINFMENKNIFSNQVFLAETQDVFSSFIYINYISFFINH